MVVPLLVAMHSWEPSSGSYPHHFNRQQSIPKPVHPVRVGEHGFTYNPMLHGPLIFKNTLSEISFETILCQHRNLSPRNFNFSFLVRGLTSLDVCVTFPTTNLSLLVATSRHSGGPRRGHCDHWQHYPEPVHPIDWLCNCH